MFDREQVLRVLHGFNPWWSRRPLSVPAYRRGIYAACRSHLSRRGTHAVLLLSGFRGAGKTTLLLQLAQDLITSGVDAKSVLYLSIEHPVFGMLPLADIVRLYHDMVHPPDRPTVLLLDELHYAADWDSQVKRLLAEGSGYSIVATESVQMIERALFTETQIGRWEVLTVPSLSFYEYLALRGADPVGAAEVLPDLATTGPLPAASLAAAAKALQSTAAHFHPYLAVGGLPGYAAHPGDASSVVLYEDVAERILRRAVARHFSARNVEDLKRLFLYACVHSGEIFRVQRYANLLGVAPSTVASHLELLERCFLLRRLPPSGPAGQEVQKARHRVYVTDATLRNAALLRGAEHLSDPQELRVSAATSVLRHVDGRFAQGVAHLSHWRDARTRREVDVVVRGGGRLLVFTMAGPRASEPGAKDGVVEFCRTEKVHRAYLITTDETDVAAVQVPGVATQFTRVPAHVVTYLLGRAESKEWSA